jgi:hypothetical protein
MLEEIPHHLKSLSQEENEAIDALLTRALHLLDNAGRYDVSAHVDLALHILREGRSG